MDSMKELKDWLVTKCRLPGFQLQTLKLPDKSDSKFGSNIVTPQTIPEFVIPGSAESSRNPSICSSDDLRSHSSGGVSVSGSPNISPAVSPRNSFSGLGVPENKSPVKIRSAPASPRRDSHGFLKDFGARSLSNLPYPRDISDSVHTAAVETPQLKARTNFGFSTLKESSHVRRNDFPGRDGKPEVEYRLQGFIRRPFRSHESLVNANEGDRDGHPAFCHRRCSPVFADQNDYLPLRESFRRSQRYYRRRSSLAQVEMTTSLWRQDSENSGFHSENPVRRIPVTCHLMTVPSETSSMKRHSDPNCIIPASSRLSDSIRNSSASSRRDSEASKSDIVPHDLNLDRLKTCGHSEWNGDHKTTSERGEIKFSFQYFPASRRLKLLLIRAENLRFPERPDAVTNPFFKVSLMPGKLQKQISETMKHTRDPVYNREFFFNDINLDELRNLRLRIKAFHKSHNLKLADYMGEVNIPLANYDLLMENRMWTDLHFKPYEQDLGHLQVELLLEPREERLTVGVVQAKGLPVHHITGAPDPYVCACVEQYGQVVAQRQTRTRKKTSDPIFREWFEVRLACGADDLLETRVRLCLYDHERLRSDPVLGEVWLGMGAKEESVVTHWKEMIHAPGRKLRRWHYILSVEETADRESKGNLL